MPTGVTGSFSGGVFTITGTPTVSGNFTYTVTTTGSSCAPEVSASGSISINALPGIGLTSAGGTDGQTVCNNSAITDITYAVTGTGSSATLSGSLPTGVTGSFSGGVFTITGTPTVSGNFTYTVTTTGSSCAPEVSANGSISINALPGIGLTSAGGTDGQTVCNNFAITDITYAITGAGSGATLTGSLPTGVTGSFSGGVFTITGTPTVSGNFTYTVTTTGSSCAPEVSASGSISINALPGISLTSAGGTDGQAVCDNTAITDITYAVTGAGSSAALSGSLPTGVTGSFSGGVFTITGTPTATGVFTYTVSTTGSTCSPEVSANGSITINTLPSVAVSGNVISGLTICSGNIDTLLATPSGGSGSGYSFSWNDGTTTQSDWVTTAGSYTATVTDGNGCMNSASQTVVVNTTPTVVVSPNAPAICPGGNVDLNASSADASTYVWTPNTNLTATTGVLVNASPTTTTTYTVIGTSSLGCASAPATAVVRAVTTLTVSVTPANPTICLNSNVTLNGNGASQFTWKAAAGLTCTSCASPVASPGSTTTYTVVGTSGSCADSATVVVTVNTLPSVTFTGNVISGYVVCAGNIDTLNATATGGSGSGYNFTWSDGTLTQADWVTTGGTYSVTVVDGNGCSATSTSQLVTVNSIPTVSVTASAASICAGSMDTLSVSDTLGDASPLVFSWNTGGTNDTIKVTPPAGSPYLVQVTDANGCTNTASQNVTVNALPTITVTGTTPINLGSTDTLTASGAVSYVWNNGGTYDTLQIMPLGTTTYTVTGTDSHGCSDTASFVVVVSPTGLTNVAISDKTSLYPNPTIDNVNLSFEMKGSAKAAVIKVVDLAGREIMSENETISNGKVVTLDVSSLPQGTYFIKITTSDKTQVERLIKL